MNDYVRLVKKSIKLHSANNVYYAKASTTINVINTAISLTISIALNIGTTITDLEARTKASIAYSVFLYLSVFLSSIKQFFKFEELAEKHRVASVRYTHLAGMIQLNADMKMIITEYEDIFGSSPTITIDDANPGAMVSAESNETDELTKETKIQLNRMLVQSYNVDAPSDI